MARLYANENFPLRVVHHLRGLGHDAITIQETAALAARIDAAIRAAGALPGHLLRVNRPSR